MDEPAGWTQQGAMSREGARMTTIPLFTVVSYLQRKGVDLACLEGAPRTWVGTKDRLLGITRADLDLIGIMGSAPPDTALYLGRDAVCPAAMGWAAVVLGCLDGMLDIQPDRIQVWRPSYDEPSFTYAWRYSQAWAYEEAAFFVGEPPPTPAARLLAVLEYEMSR